MKSESEKKEIKEKIESLQQELEADKKQRQKLADLEKEISEYESLPKPSEQEVDGIVKRVYESLCSKIDVLATEPKLQCEVIKSLIKCIKDYKISETIDVKIREYKELRASLPEVVEARCKREYDEGRKRASKRYSSSKGRMHSHIVKLAL